VIVVVLAMVLTVPVAIVVVFMVPVSLVHFPAFRIVIVVRVAPVGARVGRTVPAPLDPAVVVAIGSPISSDPVVAWAGFWSTNLNAEGRWRGSDVYRNLC
jgi:hypothetical protein